MTLTRSAVRHLLASHGLRPRRALGQNFVADPNTVRRVARLAGVQRGDKVVEIGAGLGALTLALVETGASVVTIEKDRNLVPVLTEVLAATDAEILEADAMTADLGALLRDRDAAAPWTLVANLPYNVAVPVVARTLDEVPLVRRMLVMVQREVGERLAAAPRDDAFGAVSVKVAYYARAKVVGRVPASVFVPQPKVESVLVSIARRDHVAVAPEIVDRARLFEVVRAGFAQRRKMLRRSLQGVVAPEAFAAAGVDPSARAEELSVEEWGRLAAWQR